MKTLCVAHMNSLAWTPPLYSHNLGTYSTQKTLMHSSRDRLQIDNTGFMRLRRPWLPPPFIKRHAKGSVGNYNLHAMMTIPLSPISRFWTTYPTLPLLNIETLLTKWPAYTTNVDCNPVSRITQFFPPALPSTQCPSSFSTSPNLTERGLKHKKRRKK